MKRNQNHLLKNEERNYQNISHREKEVLNLIAWEYSTKEIAEILYISAHTALCHRKRLLFKFGVRNTAGLIRRAFETQILTSTGLADVHAA